MILAGDIGGTKSLLALFDAGPRVAAFEQRLGSHDFADFPALLEHFLGEARTALGAVPRLESACFGIAGPVRGERVRVTNLPWTIDAAELRARFGVARLALLNDFAAAGWGLAALVPDDLATLQAGVPVAEAARVVLGAGTGFGAAYVLGGMPRAGEAGHAGFAPANAEQAALWHFLHARHGRVQLEEVLSGHGLASINEFLTGTRAAPEDASPRARDLFIACYGAAAGDLALHVMARGGVYVAGGIAPKLLPHFAAGGFLEAFNDKGAFSEHMRRMPLHVVTNERLGLMGAAVAAARAK